MTSGNRAAVQDLEPIPVRGTAHAQAVELLPAIPSLGGREGIIVSYEWFDPANRQEFLSYLRGLIFIRQHGGVGNQLRLYQAKLAERVAKDQVERVAGLVRQTLGYEGLKYHHPEPLPVGGFRVPIICTVTHHTVESDYWQFRRLAVASQLVPPSALQAWALLEQAKVLPEALWVAEKRRAMRPLRDPLLCVSFGRWVVAIAQWE
jgi:hypothetical protein